MHRANAISNTALTITKGRLSSLRSNYAYAQCAQRQDYQ
jgi:hypothetical protein